MILFYLVVDEVCGCGARALVVRLVPNGAERFTAVVMAMMILVVPLCSCSTTATSFFLYQFSLSGVR